ncbi:hypothetical protein B296_00002774 [Ensete ventricosum]|uniref:Uncharacterized protein n=1 Tax=Ensete ventricosum TaxID=4639 RepID=A0A427A8P2_ENSVE|nr:hypothetical protein B296_00002774 [Ensete ventricosum]
MKLTATRRPRSCGVLCAACREVERDGHFLDALNLSSSRSPVAVFTSDVCPRLLVAILSNCVHVSNSRSENCLISV